MNRPVTLFGSWSVGDVIRVCGVLIAVGMCYQIVQDIRTSQRLMQSQMVSLERDFADFRATVAEIRVKLEMIEKSLAPR